MSSPLRQSLSYFDRNLFGPKNDIAETCVSDVSRASQTAKRGFRQSRPDAICRASSSVSPATPSPVA